LATLPNLKGPRVSGAAVGSGHAKRQSEYGFLFSARVGNLPNVARAKGTTNVENGK
jgi:hypothetical protein